MASPAQEPLPSDWYGHWEGTIELRLPGFPPKVGMSLDIAKIPQSPRYTWTIQYEGQPPRQYDLVPIEGDHFVVDEKNGILIDTYLQNNVIHSAFDVSGNRIVSQFRLDGNRMHVAFQTYTVRPVRETPEPLPVASYGLKGSQIGVLHRT